MLGVDRKRYWWGGLMIALFDLDGTLIKPKSVIAFYEFYLLNTQSADESTRSLAEFRTALGEQMQLCESRMDLNRWFYQSYFAGMSRPVLARHCRAWVENCMQTDDFFHPEILVELDQRRYEGYEPVIVTGSFYEVVKPIADHLGISNILCAPLEDQDDVYTGRLLALPTIAAGKVEAINKFLTREARDLDASYGYGDDLSDLDYLELVDHPVAFNGADLGAVALDRDWTFIPSAV